MNPMPGTNSEKVMPLGLALAILGLILLGGSGLIWKYLYRSDRGAHGIHTVVPSPGNPHVAGRPAPMREDGRERAKVMAAVAEAELPDGVYPREGGGGGDVLFKAGDAYFKVAVQEWGVSANFGFFTLSEREWEHGYLTLGVRRILAQEEFARELGVNEGQRKGLGALPEAPAARWPDIDRERFLDLYRAWAKADASGKGAAGVRVVEALAAYAEQKRAADRKVMEERVTRIRAILDPKQLGKINPIPRWEFSATQRARGATTRAGDGRFKQ
jgi:hypothetical protein